MSFLQKLPQTVGWTSATSLSLLRVIWQKQFAGNYVTLIPEVPKSFWWCFPLPASLLGLWLFHFCCLVELMNPTWRSHNTPQGSGMSALCPLQAGRILIPPQCIGVIRITKTGHMGLSGQQPCSFCGHPFVFSISVVLFLLPRACCWESLQLWEHISYTSFQLLREMEVWLCPCFCLSSRPYAEFMPLQTGNCHPATTLSLQQWFSPPLTPYLTPRASLLKSAWKGIASLRRLLND